MLAARATAFEQAERALGTSKSLLAGGARSRARRPKAPWRRRSAPSRARAAELQQLEAEIKALAELAGPEPHGSPVIDLVEVARRCR